MSRRTTTSHEASVYIEVVILTCEVSLKNT